MHNGIFKLGWIDLLKGVITAVSTAVLIILYNIIIVSGFDFFTADWNAIFHSVVNGAGITFVGYLFRSLMTTNDGKFANMIQTG